MTSILDGCVLLFLAITINIPSSLSSNHTCESGQDCVLIFDSYQSAYELSIECPSDYLCSITCSDPISSTNQSTSYQTCQSLFIDASLSSALSIDCSGNQNCQNIGIPLNSRKLQTNSMHAQKTKRCHRSKRERNNRMQRIQCLQTGSI